jgi:hypothetical protein
MNAKVRKLEKQLERAGGRVVIPDDLPVEVAELFIKEIMSCPDCAAAIAAESKLPARRREH